ncbi:branched-chain amino acid ABC transporter permease [Isoptericola variabilis]|uniref:ABC-type transporter, integral membrane subunit n=1 Tax=Isoptericola variabilis (strain 225) TaxID=743718 RepID=F6FWM7_ISOV2|nr:branched-chain amino acid ABC transporter permease [Isoptericola variabilis]AEG45668.1 ABC-type transporter, integral membrane subunit [Isoptericola variabilis 225]TWH33781.1 branched-chain amino acid transport system permease protein [Isoptericola variabilis J7]
MTATLQRAPAAPARPARTVLVRRLPGWCAVAAGVLAALWVLFLADGTPAGPAVTNPGVFAVTVLDAVTFAGLLFVAASGFTLIFGLMRTVNMTHGSLFLLAAYVAIRTQEAMVGRSRNIGPEDVGLLDWIVPMLVGATVAAVLGLLIQQVFLQWNEGQELRQALITLAITVVLADQMLREFGGLAGRVVWPGAVTHFFTVFGERYASSRVFMLGVALLVGVLLWLWLTRSNLGMVIRAGVDDRQMVRGLGINITLVFAVTFFVGSFLAGVGGVLGASFAGVAPGTDANWLLNSLVVVIVGGLGSIKGAVAGSLLYGTVVAFSPAYLPAQYSFYAIIVTFALLAVVLAVRPYGLLGRPA